MTKLVSILSVLLSLVIVPNVFGEITSISEIAPMNEGRGIGAISMGPDGNIYAFGGGGGVYPPGVLSSVERYNPSSNSWSYLNDMPDLKAWQRVVTAQNGLMYSFGGSVGSEGSTDVWAYNPTNDTWDTSITPMPIAQRDTVAVSANNGNIYLISGYPSYTAVQAFNPSTTSWEIKSSIPTGRWGAAGALGPDGKIYVVGGGNLTTLEAYDPVTDSWESRASMPTGRTYLGAAFGGDGLLYAIGGEVYPGSGVGLTVIESYDPISDVWSTAGNLPVQLTYLSGQTFSDASGGIYVIGGNEPDGPSTTGYYISTSIVPEPISSLLFLSGGTFLVGRRYLRSRN